MLTNSYAELPGQFYQKVCPEQFPDPELVLFNQDLANELSLSFSNDSETAQVLSGQVLLPGSEPIAQAYAGSQFGHFVPQLGDGRAHLLGEIRGLDLQLKGSGRTKFSRGGDGRSALGPAIREFLVSETMHTLGVPTTRALSVVATGELVQRQYGPEPGGILARIADSHIRIGTFQYFQNLEDLEALEKLSDYTIRRHYPDVSFTQLSDRCLELLRLFAKRQGELVAKWYGLGFIHGVMNTDNCTLAGITIDYGPCAFLDEFKFMKVFSSIDEQGRYAYGNQMAMVEWNILRFAECLIPLIADDPQLAVNKIKEALEEILSNFPNLIHMEFARKLGLTKAKSENETFITEFISYLETHSLDFTLSFSNLRKLYDGETEFFPVNSQLKTFLAQWKDLNPDLSQIDAVNPCLIPRNHQIENVIKYANQADYNPLKEMWEALKNPFDVSPQHQHFMGPPRLDEKVYQTFCGT